MKLKTLFAVTALTFITVGAAAQKTKPVLSPKPELVKLIDKQFKFGAAQYKILAKKVPNDSLPESFENGKSRTITAKNWVSGFYPGTLFYLYEATGDQEIHELGLAKLPVMEPIKNLDSHDIGFMMYCSFGNANRLKPVADYNDVLVTSAKTLAKRFNPNVGCTMSWGSKPGEFRVIIDNMMNLELLMWASKYTGDPSYAKVAVTHANTTLKNHFRPDGSSYHLVNYNSETGGIIRKQTVQGYADDSAWARGQAWGLYGYTMMYRETKDTKYLEQAKKIAHFILNHPNLPADKIPYWDFNSPGIPNDFRDASAAAINASALLELAGYVDNTLAAKYVNVAETVIKTLASGTYTSPYAGNGGFILKHSVAHLPKGAMIDVPLTYADYYYMEAMLRYKNLSKKNNE